MRISGTKPSSVILGQTCSIKSWKVMTKKNKFHTSYTDTVQWKEDTYRFLVQRSRSSCFIISILSCNTIAQISFNLWSKAKVVVISCPLAGPHWLCQFSNSHCCEVIADHSLFFQYTYTCICTKINEIKAELFHLVQVWVIISVCVVFHYRIYVLWRGYRNAAVFVASLCIR